MPRAKSDDRRDVYLITGETDTRREAFLDELVKRFLDTSFTEFDLERFDGNTSSAESIMGAALTMPLGSGRKVIIVDRVDRLSPEDQSRIAAFTAKLPARSCLILINTEDPSSGRKSASAQKAKPKDSEADADQEQSKRRKGLQSELLSAVKSHGEIKSFEKLKTDNLRTLAVSLARKHGKRIEQAAAQALAHAVEANPSVLEREIEKLTAYTDGQAAITAADVDAVVSRSPEDRVFRMIDAVAARRPDLAAQALSETLSASIRPDDEARRVTAMVGKHFRILFQAKYLRLQGVGNPGIVSEELQAMLSKEATPLISPDWRRKKVFEQADSFSLAELRKCLKQVLLCEMASKGIGDEVNSPRLNLEMLILKLSQPRRSTSA